MPPTKRKADALSGEHSSSIASKKSFPSTGESTSCTPVLPAPVWGRILDFLPYCDVRKALLICRAVCFEATNYVMDLSICDAAELNVRAARRFANVEAIQIGCILTNGVLNAKAVGKVVPFMTSFPNLNWCRIGEFSNTNTPKATSYRLKQCKDPDDHSVIYRSMLEALSGAFESSALSNTIRLIGFMVPGRVYSCDPKIE